MRESIKKRIIMLKGTVTNQNTKLVTLCHGVSINNNNMS